MNRNRQITLIDYAECVSNQIDFLHRHQGSQPTRTDIDPAMLVEAVREFYNHSVSVDAAADDLLHQGF